MEYVYSKNVSLPVDMQAIAWMQVADTRLQAMMKEVPDQFKLTKVDKSTMLLMYRVKMVSDCFFKFMCH